MSKGRGLASIGESGWRFLLATYGCVRNAKPLKQGYAISSVFGRG